MSLSLLKKTSYHALPQKMKRNFETEIARRNYKVERLMLPLTMLIELFNMIHLLFFREAGLTTYFNKMYFTMYAALFGATLLFFIVQVASRNKFAKHLRLTSRAELAYVALFAFWCTGITILDQRSNDNIYVFLLGMLTVAMLIYLKPWKAVALFSVNQVLLFSFFTTFQPQPADNFGSYLNTSIISLMSICISVARYQGRLEDYRKQQVIALQNRKISDINRQLRALALTDELSGLYNRRYLDRMLSHKWKDCVRNSESLSVVMLDIDDFKKYNDRYGHQAGDRCIMAIAEKIKLCFGQYSDFLLRYGGEEFTIVLSGMDTAQVLALVREFCCCVEQLNIPHEDSIHASHITVSAGIFHGVPTPETQAHDFIANADRALYRAKKNGKNCAEIAN